MPTTPQAPRRRRDDESVDDAARDHRSTGVDPDAETVGNRDVDVGGDPGKDGTPGVGQAGIVPQEDEATGYLPVTDGEDSYEELRLPHERDESVDPPPVPKPRKS